MANLMLKDIYSKYLDKLGRTEQPAVDLETAQAPEMPQSVEAVKPSNEGIMEQARKYIMSQMAPKQAPDLFAKTKAGKGVLGKIAGGVEDLANFLNTSAGKNLLTATTNNPHLIMQYAQQAREAQAQEAAKAAGQEQFKEKIAGTAFEKGLEQEAMGQKLEFDKAKMAQEAQAALDKMSYEEKQKAQNRILDSAQALRSKNQISQEAYLDIMQNPTPQTMSKYAIDESTFDKVLAGILGGTAKAFGVKMPSQQAKPTGLEKLSNEELLKQIGE